MLTAIRNNRSLTFYQQSTAGKVELSPAYVGGMSLATTSKAVYITTTITNKFNTQLDRYINFCSSQERSLIQKTAQYMTVQRNNSPDISNSDLRDKSTWACVKKLVTREELMKLQISDKTSLPLSDEELQNIKIAINGKDLSVMSDSELNKIIESVVNTDKQKYLNALKQFKETGTSSELLQSAKLKALADELEKIDLSKVSNEQIKKIIEKYCEKIEFHHKESISSNPNKQSNPNNVEPVRTSQHDAKHTDMETGKINYKKPVKEKMLNRKQEMRDGNKKRIFKNELRGLGIAVAIGAGVGLTIGFVASLAQSGITPESLRLATIEGAKGGVEAGVMSAVGYGLGRSLGEMVTKAATGLIENLGINITENLAQMVNMGVAGTLTIIVFSAYQFTKLKLSGVATRDALMQTGKQTLFSLSLLAVSIAAQGIWGGCAGIIVSVSVGVIMISYTVIDSTHQRRFAEKVRIYTIEKCYPTL